MTRRLFFTGPIGCGKSTAIRTALGERLSQCGGLITRRYREPYLHFTAESPDGSRKATFLDLSTGKPEVTLQVFSPAALQGDILILDEIGGVELLNGDFAKALEEVLKSDVPILGVVKGSGPASALVEALALTEEYRLAAERLREQLGSDPNTTLYECSQFDEHARHLAEQWAEEYLHD